MLFFISFFQIIFALPQEVTFTNELIEAPKPFAMPSIGREGVDYRGDLSLSIPLMTVKGRNGLDFPLIAYYHSGIKVRQPASWIGLGWNLEIGSVTRIPINIYDFHAPTWDCSSYKDSADPLPDKFVVTTPTSSINFSNITSSSSGGTASDQIHLNPKFVSAPIDNGEDLEGTRVSLGHHAFDYSKFIYYAPDGTRYIYELGLKSNGIDLFWNGDEEKFSCPEEPHNVKWLLTAILSPDYVDGSSPQDLNPLNSTSPAADNKGNWVAIEYYPVKAYHYAHDFDWQAYNADPANYVPPLFHKEITYLYRIVTPTNVAEFVLEDEFAGENIVNPETLSEWNNPFESGDSLKGEKTKRLKEIKLFKYSGTGSNPAGQIIEGIDFNYALKDASLAHCTVSGNTYGAKTTLKNIYLKGSDGSFLPPYSFDYNESMSDYNPSYPCYNLAYDSQNSWILLHEDMFGYYSTFENGLDLLYQEIPLNDAKAWSLAEIAYPSGAKKKFTYGDDTIWHDFGQGAKYYALGGTRIRKIEIQDDEESNYAYSYSYSASGEIPNMGFMSSTPIIWLKHKYHIYNPYENPNSVNYFYPIAEEESFVYYDQIDEVFEGEGWRTRRNFALYNRPDRTNIIPDPVKYPGGSNQVCASSYWCVQIPFKNAGGLNFLIYSFQHSENSGMRGNEYSEEYYNSQNKLVKKITYSRNPYLINEIKYFGTSSDSYLLFTYYWDGLTSTRSTYYDESGNSVDILNRFDYAMGPAAKDSWQYIRILSEEEQFKYSSPIISSIRKKEIVYAWDTGRGPPFDEHDFSGMKQAHIYTYPYQTWYLDCKINSGTEACKWLDKQERTLYEKYGNRWYKSKGLQWLDRNKNGLKEADEWITTQYLNYDNYGNVGKIVSPDGNETIMEYDPAFNYAYLKKITRKNPAGIDLVTQYSYDSLTQQLSSITDPNNFTANYYYDDFSRLKSIQKPLDAGPSVNYEYLISNTESDWIKKTQKIDETKNSVGIEYFDGLGRSIGTRTLNSGNDILTKTEYDLAGRAWKQFKPYKESEGQNYFTETQYYADPLNRVNKIIPPASSSNITTNFGVNNGIRNTTLIDEKGHDKRSSFNEFGELVKVEECSNDSACSGTYTNANSYEYNYFGDLNSVTDAEGHKTEYYYDTLGRLVKEVHPDTGTTELKYDDEGNLIQKITPKGTINYEYDALNRLTKIDYPSGTDVINAYDSCLNGKGKLCQVTDESGITSFEYDERGRLTKETAKIDGKAYVTEYTYNSADGIETIKYPDPQRTTLKFYYNELNQIDHADNLTLSLQLASFSYNPNNSVKEVDYGNQVKASYDYYPRDWMKSIDIKDPGNNALFQRYFEYDAAGNLEKTYMSAAPGQGQLSASYSYDGLDRLLSATINYPVNKTLNYSYDKAGNRQTMNDSGVDYSYGYAYETAGQSQELLEVKKAGVPLINLSYDAAGNLEGKNCSGPECSSASYSYDSENGLERIDFSDGSFSEFIYNYKGLRAEKIEGSNNSISFNVTYYLYDLKGNALYERNIAYTAGDPNNDSKSTIADVVFMVNYLFKGGNVPALLLAADPNGDCKQTVADVVYLVSYLFKGGHQPLPGCHNEISGQGQALLKAGNAGISFGSGRIDSLNKTVLVPITAKLDSNASAVEISLNYDAKKLIIQGASTTVRTNGMQLAFSGNSGKFVAGLISPDGSKSISSGSGEIIVLSVKPANFSSIDLSSLKLNEIEVIDEKALEFNLSISSNTATIPLTKTVPKTGLVTTVE
ncbi:MAG: DUF6443 domain-containing protein [Candidatus Diapherotrites archaeon]